MSNLKWRVYYDDGSTFDNTQGSPADSPGWGVVAAVTQHHYEGRVFQTRKDVYAYDPSCGWVGIDWIGLLDRLANRIPTEAVSFGRMLPNTQYDEIHRIAVTDPDFPPKTGKVNGER